MPLSPYDEALATVLFDAIPGVPGFKRLHEQDDRAFVDIARFADDPVPGVDTFATLGVSHAPLMDGGRDTGLRVEFIGACRREWPEFAGMLASAAFGVLAGEQFVYPGRVLPRLVELYYPELPTRHLLLQPPFAWEGLGKVDVLDRTVLWLTPVPITDTELVFLREHGEERLVEALVDVDYTDLAREGVV